MGKLKDEEYMNERLTNILNTISNYSLLAGVILIPLFFWTQTTEFYETPKMLLLYILVAILLLVWALRSFFSGRVIITRTPLDLPFLLIVAVLIVSTFFLPSNSRVLALIGNLPRVNGGVASFLLYIALYFLMIANLKSASVARQIAYLFIGVSGILAIVSILAFAGIKLLPFDFAAGLNFTPAGSSFSASALMAMAIPFLLLAIIQRDIEAAILTQNTARLAGLGGAMIKLISAALLTVLSVAIALIGSLPAFVAVIVSYLMVLFIATPAQLKKNTTYLFTPLLVGAAVLFFAHIPVAPSGNPIYAQAQKFPRELQLPFQSSWVISVSAFRDAPFWGTGPATYQSDFTLYKPAEFNQTPVWNVNFDQAYNEYLQFLATLGATGLIALLLLTVLLVSLALKSFSIQSNGLGKAAGLSALVFFVLLLFHTSTVVVWSIGIMMLAMFMAVSHDATEELHIGIAATKRGQSQMQVRFDALPALMILIVAGIIIGSGYLFGRFALADYHHRRALNAQTNALLAYNELQAAEQLNIYADLYHVELAQTNFILANAIAVSKGPTEASPAGSLTDQDKSAIQTFLTQSINEGRAAVTINPKSATDWEVLGSIYRQISGVAKNALTFAADAYGRALQLDPLNPALRLTYGGIYYQVKNYNMAIKYFSDAVTAKPDYANGYYNLAVALKDNGNLSEAKMAAEQTVSLLQTNTASQDYQTASKLLSDINAQIASQSASAQSSTPPAAQATSPLQNENMPKVLNLPAKENVATPPAVQKPETTPKPTPTTQSGPTTAPTPKS